MKFAIECDVESSIEIPKEVLIKAERREYAFIPNGANTLHKVRVTADVSDPKQFALKAIQDGTFGPTIVIGNDAQLCAEMTHELQELESLLAFSLNLCKIHWEHPRTERIAQNPGERGFTFHNTPEHREPKIPVSEEVLTGLVKKRELLSSLTVVKSFWREARNSYNASRYISAFVNAFFILEGLYAKGQFSKNGISREFLAHPPFVDSIKQLFVAVQDECPEHLEAITAQLKQRGKMLNVKEFTVLLVKTRAELSHFVLRDLDKRERLFEENYWSMSFL